MTENPKRILPEGWWHERDLLVLYGFDPAEAARSLRSNGQQRMVCVVPEGGADPGSMDLPEGVVAVRRANELMGYVQRIEGQLPALIHLYVLPGTPITDEERRLIGETLAKAVKSWHVNRSTLDQFGGLWMRQTLGNLDRLAEHPTVRALAGKFSDRPVVIVSPGPSLEKNIEQLHEVVGKAVIMTCPHALAALEKRGIVPDVVVVGDAKTLAWQYGDYDFSRVPALVLMAPADPGLFALPARNTFVYSFNPDVDGWAFAALGVNAFLVSGGSVACIELSLAMMMGAPEIYFIGQDLAFEDGRYYASSVRDGETVARVEDGTFTLERNLPVDEFNHKGKRTWRAKPMQSVEVPGWHGGSVQTSHVFTIFLDWFSVILRSTLCNARVFNCTEGGAYIDGMLHIPFERAIQRVRVAAEDLGQRITDCANQRDRDAAYRTIGRLLDDYRSLLLEVRSGAQTCASLSSRAQSRPELLPQLERAERKLRRSLARVPFLSLSDQAEVRAATKSGAQAGDIASSLEASGRIFQVVLKSARDLLPLVDEAKARFLESQAEEAA